MGAANTRNRPSRVPEVRRHLLFGFAAAASLLIVLGATFGVARSTPVVNRAATVAQTSPAPSGMCVVNQTRCGPQLPTDRQAPSAPVRPVAIAALTFVAVLPAFFVLRRRRAARLAIGVRPPILHPPRLRAGVI
jgi:hypothetical protein